MSELTNPSAAADAGGPSPVASPCVSLCKMDRERRYCMGCLRTIEEIIGWSTAGDDAKRAVWQEIARRKQLVSFDGDGFVR